MSDLPEPILHNRRWYFMCLGCQGPGACTTRCPCKQWPKTPEANVEVCLELHRHKTFGPELWGVARRSDPDLPFSPKAVKEKLEQKYKKIPASTLAKRIAKRNVKNGVQQSMLAYMVDKTTTTKDTGSTSNDAKPAAK